MADALQGRLARRQAFMEDLFEALTPLLGPRVSFEAAGGKGVTVLVDGGMNGAMITRAAPWLPRLPVAIDLTATARGVAYAAMWVATEFPPGTTTIGPRLPSVSRTNGSVRIQFFGVGDEPLPAVEVPLHRR